MSSKTRITGTEEEARPALVPKLRFPGFRESDAWEPTTIGALGRFYYGKSAPKWSLAEDAPTPCVRYGELYTKFGPVITETYSRTNTDPETLRFSKGGEILIPRVGEKPEDFGKCCAYLPLKGIAIGEMISVFETKQYPLFYTYYFRNLHEQFAKVVEGQNVKNLYFSELEPLPIHRPSFSEQQKIAECLSSVDELIAAQARKMDALKTHKKGLMQQLFPREGETQPRLRFREFQNAGEWGQTTVEQLIVTVTPPKKLRTTDYQQEGKFPIVDQSQDYICGWTNDGEALIDKGLPVIVFGDHTCALKFIDQPFVQGADGIKIFRPKRGIDIRFLFCALEAEPVVQESYKRHFSLLKDKKLFYPDPKSGEQERIASCLSSLDELIAAETQKLKALKTHKNGLMQQLFPAPEEVGA